MKANMSGFDLRAIVGELNQYVGAYVKKSYMPHYEQIVLRINPKSTNQFDLVIVRGSRVYTSNRDRPMPQTPPPFAMILRKYLKNARMIAVRQLGFDRVLAIDFDTKFGIMHLYIEVFREGNIILVDSDGIIIQPLTHAKYSERILKKGVQYSPPPPATDPHDLDATALQEIFANSERDLVATLGGKANLGGTHANAVCALAELEPNSDTKSVDVSKVHRALSGLLDGLANAAQGYLILAPDEGQSISELQSIADQQVEGGERDKFLLKYAIEASPTLLPAHSDKVIMHFKQLCQAVDAWRGAHDAGALARREAEKLDVAAPGRGFSTEVEKLERRQAQQEKALESFAKKIAKQQMIGHTIQNNWSHVENLLNQVKESVQKNGWRDTQKMAKQIPWIVSMTPADRSFITILPNDEGQPKGAQALLMLDESVHQNAQRFFEAARKQKAKSKGAITALEDTSTHLKRARKKEVKAKESGRLSKVKRSKRLWFENHRWSMVTGGHLLVGGKDAKGNDAIVKKHLSGGDMYLHADIHGAPSCSLRATQGFVIDEFRPGHIPSDIPTFKLVDKLGEEQLNDEKLLQAATLALCWSRAWASGSGHGTVFAVKPAQVSKTAQSGEFVGKGAFIVRGQRQWFRDLTVQLGIGIIAINGVPLLMSGIPELIKQTCPRYAILSPGIVKKDKLANRIYKNTGISTDEILAVLPGPCDVVEESGIFTAPKAAGEEE